ncbi:MAG: hypothetical protein ACXW05_03005 [Gemmatirosa sp.]
MTLTRLAASPPVRALAPPAELARALDGLVRTPYRAFAHAAGPWLAAPFSPRMVTPPALLDLARTLSGRLVVTNPTAVVRLPWAVGLLARAALRRALRPAGTEEVPSPADAHDVRAQADRRRLAALVARLPDAARALAPGARWAAAAFYEPTTLVVHLASESEMPRAPEPLRAHAVLRYRLVLVTGRGEAVPTPEALDAAAIAAPAILWPPGRPDGTPWFIRRLLLPDAHVAAHMDESTLARWAALTGRGGAQRDRYWYRESWERFREPGQRVGFVAPDYVARARRLAAPVADVSTSLLGALDANVERGVCVPPGYCLVDCVGTLELAVVSA